MKKISFFLVLFLLIFTNNAQAQSLESKLKGKILLQVEENGEAWYLNPQNEKRYYMGRPADAFRLMRELGVGISNADLKKIPISLSFADGLDSDNDGIPDEIEKAIGTDPNKPDTDGDGFSDAEEIKNGYNPLGPGKLNLDKSLSEKLKGKILLQVESRGEAWYVNPEDAKRYYLGKPGDAFNLMKRLGLGIKNSDLEKIAKTSDTPKKQTLSASNDIFRNTLIEDLRKQKDIKKFDNEEEFAAFLKNNQKASSQSFDLRLSRSSNINDSGWTTNSGENTTLWSNRLNSVQSGYQSEDSVSDYSTTNIQVEGVDEADIVKTDGSYIYTLSENMLFIIKAFPNEKVMSKIEFKGLPHNIYLNNDRLAVFGRHDYYQNELYKDFRRKNSFTFLEIFDISDRSNPKKIKDLHFEGSYSNSRMIGDYIYLITDNRHYSHYENELALPRILSNDKLLKSSCLETDCINRNIYYFDLPYRSYNAVSISSINIKDTDEEIKGEVYLLNSGQNFYVSKDNIYLSYTKYLSESQFIMSIYEEIIIERLGNEDLELIKKIKEADKAVVSPQEKQSKIYDVLRDYYSRLSINEMDALDKEMTSLAKERYADVSIEFEKTVIHKISIDKGNLRYQGNGEVKGHVLNQFSMDESTDGYFRIATTKAPLWSIFEDGQILSHNNLYILDKDLNTVGSLEKLAEDEHIKSVRFMQDRAYMVTFKEIDPLFVIDIKDHTNPKVLGELKIPGYSDYLHPYNDKLLIGLGRDAYEHESGRTVIGGIKLSLFDVSDVSSPKEIDNHIMGGTGSQSFALDDHKAFYFNRQKNIIGIPATIKDNGSLFIGAIITEVDENGFNPKGRITHVEDDSEPHYTYEKIITRILHINENLYTVSGAKIKINEASDLKEKGFVNLIEASEIPENYQNTE